MPSVFRPGSLSYLRIPAAQPARLAGFYAAVFGWQIEGGHERPSFSDGSGHVIGHFVAGEEVAGEAGVRPYIYVDSVAETVAAVAAAGGEIVTKPYAEGDLSVATFRDPDGNVLGIWERVGVG